MNWLLRLSRWLRGTTWQCPTCARWQVPAPLRIYDWHTDQPGRWERTEEIYCRHPDCGGFQVVATRVIRQVIPAQGID